MIAFNRLKNAIKCKVYGNFIVFNCPTRIVCTLFSTGHVNATGIKMLDQINDTADKVMSQLNDALQESSLSIDKKGTRVDNISAAGFYGPIRENFLKIISRMKLIECVYDNVLKVSYNNQKFPGLFIKTQPAMIIAYKSGKFVIVGSRTLKSLKQTASIVRLIFLHSNKNIK